MGCMGTEVKKTAVRIRQSRYAVLVEYSKIVNVPVEELVDRALSSFIHSDIPAERKAMAGK